MVGVVARATRSCFHCRCGVSASLFADLKDSDTRTTWLDTRCRPRRRAQPQKQIATAIAPLLDSSIALLEREREPRAWRCCPRLQFDWIPCRTGGNVDAGIDLEQADTLLLCHDGGSWWPFLADASSVMLVMTTLLRGVVEIEREKLLWASGRRSSCPCSCHRSCSSGSARPSSCLRQDSMTYT